jgi:ferredoxin
MNGSNNKIDFKKFKKAVIYYFSGTGNTLYVIEKYKELFLKENIYIELIDISQEHIIKSQSKYDFVAFAYPTYACYPPLFVKKFIEGFPNVKNKPCFIISTATKLHGDALGVSSRILKKKNYNIIATLKYFMPHNVSFIFKKKSPKQKTIDSFLKKTNKKIEEDFYNLINNKTNPQFKNLFFISKISSWFFNTFIIKVGNNKQNIWVVDHNICNQCGLCEKLCPNNNIIVKTKKRKVVFGNNCLFCTRCYNFCPLKAIEYKKNKFKKDYRRYTKFKNLFLK